jgi:DNA-cytosine methyltransferase
VLVDVRKVSGSQILAAARGSVDLLAGGPNCQGVSQRGVRSPDDPRNFMFAEYVRLVSEVRPTAFLMENVPGLAHRHNFEVMSNIFESFKKLGYRCVADVLLAADYGVPQLRYRFVMIGTLNDMPLTLPAPSHTGEPGLFGCPYVTVWDAIGDLPQIDASRQKDQPLPYAAAPASDFQRYVRDGSEVVHNHICSATETINLDRARHVREGGNWKDIPASVLPDRFFVCRMTDHSTTYARLRRDQPAFTITALFGNITAGAFTHPLSNRALSIREGGRLQSFRDRFLFCGPRNSQYRQIGNAVPPLLGKAVAEHLRRLLSGERPAGLQPRITEAVLKDRRAWDRLPILTPRFRALFGAGTRWPAGWGPEPADYSEMLDKNYSLRQEFLPARVREQVRKKGRKKAAAS